MEWTGNYITDFSKLLPQLRSDDFTYDEVRKSGLMGRIYVLTPFQEKDENASSDEEAHFSLITGQYKTGPFHRSGGTAKDGKHKEDGP